MNEVAEDRGLTTMTVTSHHRRLLVALLGLAAVLYSLLGTAVAPSGLAASSLSSESPRASFSGFGPTPSIRLKSDAGHRSPRGADLAGPLSAPVADGDLWIVQRRGALSAEFRQRLSAEGAVILAYIPDDAYLVRAQRPALDRVGQASDVVTIVPYRPIDRVSGELLELAAVSGHDGGDEYASIEVRVSGFRDTPVEALATRVRGAAPGVALMAVTAPGHGRPEVVANLLGRNLADFVRELANDSLCEYIEQVTPVVPLNDDATWILQTGVNLDRKLFTVHGLTGVGQIVGLADVGIDADACQFRFASDLGTAPNATQPPSVQVTNPDDKVRAYYLLSGAEAGDSPVLQYHGSRVAGCMAGDDYTGPGGSVPRTNPFTVFAPGPDPGDGMAPGAQIVVQDIGTVDGGYVAGQSTGQLLQQAYGSGVRVHNSSYGVVPTDRTPAGPTSYGGSSASVDDALWRLRDLSAVWAAGNWGAVDPVSLQPWDGRSSLTGLGAVAKSSVTVGATGNPGAAGESIERLVAESSRGPTIEGLAKPDVVAPGHNLTTLGDVATNPTCATDRLVAVAFGTSFAAGAVSGVAALVRQYFTDGYYPGGVRTRTDLTLEPVFVPSNALVKAVLINSSRNLTGANTADTNTVNCAVPVAGCTAPSAGQGWGRVTLDDGLYFANGAPDARRLVVLRDLWNGGDATENAGRGDDPIARGAITHLEVHAFSLVVPPGVPQELRCTLVWSDPAGSPAAAAPLVNDLNLEVHGPGSDGVVGTPDDQTYHGNEFFADQPLSDTTSGWDRTNPVENVWIQGAPAGVYNIRVIARSVPGNGVSGVAAEPVGLTGPIDSTSQGYALVCSGGGDALIAPPEVEASAVPSPAVGCPGLVVDFMETLCSTCVAWQWDLGDGTVLGGQSVQHVFSTPGLYQVRVIGRDANGSEGVSSILEVIVGNLSLPTQRVSNSFKLVEVAGAVRATWVDLAVPDATSYNLYRFANKGDVSSTTVDPPGSLINTPPNPLSGTPGYTWLPQSGDWFYQVRAANCLGQAGP